MIVRRKVTFRHCVYVLHIICTDRIPQTAYRNEVRMWRMRRPNRQRALILLWLTAFWLVNGLLRVERAANAPDCVYI